MALLQISEPGAARTQTAARRAIGIDLGTTHSLVATVKEGRPEVIPDAEGDVLLPSVVHVGLNGMEVGQPALAAASHDAINVIASVKRLMGRSLSEVEGQGRWLQELQAQQGALRLKTRVGWLSPVEISSEILKVLARRAELAMSGPAVGCVITVPAYFDDAQRQATRDAARLAGLTVLRLLSEPTAAAVAYGLDHGAEGLHLVYDLGGGTLDVSVLRLQQGIFEVLATAGDTSLGGDDIDHALVGWVQEQSGIDQLNDEEAFALRMAARAAKHALSDQEAVSLSLRAWSGELTRVNLEEIAAPWVDKSLRCVRRAMRDAGVEIADIREVVMVGGSTRMPLVRQRVAQWLGRQPLTHLDPDCVVALGAARQADVLVGNKPDVEMLLLDVLPLSLGLETMGGLVEKFLPRNSTIPASRSQEFTTYRDGQTAMAFHVVQGEREKVEDCRSLARFELRGLPARVAGALKVRVTFQVDADGLLSVSAQDSLSGQRAEVRVKPSYGLSEEEIATMLRAAYEQAEHDKQERQQIEQRVEADRLLEAVASALAEDGELLLSPDQRQLLQIQMEQLRLAIYDKSPQVFALTEQLSEASQDFAARRMDAGVRRALSGQNIEQLER
ncbi:MAG: Fe-S protein assembly chaperone HscA [Pseudomonadales bacterium]|nr:Fe-S protein assembly chaperone HscA [Pseudomonadales bacterium]